MNLEDQFTSALHNTYRVAREHGYIASYFLQMLEKYGGLATAKRLLAMPGPQTGLIELWKLDLLGESMEAVVLQERFRSLFTKEEIKEAQQRLDEFGYYH